MTTAHDHDHPPQDHGRHAAPGHSGSAGGGGSVGRALAISLALNLLIPAAQLAGAYLSGSSALMADALHNLSDFAALALAWAGLRLSLRPPSPSHTFGFERAQVITAFVNVLGLVAVSLFLVASGVYRIFYPEPVQAGLMILLALVGLIANTASAWLLHGHGDVNTRAAFLHMIGDALTSVGVLAAGAALLYRPWWLLDGATAVAIGLYIGYQALALLRRTSGILMNAAPAGLDLDEVMLRVRERFPAILDIHHVHAWELGTGGVSLTAHVRLADQPLSAVDRLAGEIRSFLSERFAIRHVVLQFEAERCEDPWCRDLSPSAPADST